MHRLQAPRTLVPQRMLPVRSLARSTEARGASLDAEQTHIPQGFPASFAHYSVLQPRLSVSQPDDPLEREADRIADSVVEASGPVTAPSPLTATSSLQRKCSACERESELAPQVQRKCSACAQEEPLPTLQRSAEPSAEAPAAVSPVPTSPGAPLAPPVQRFMESRLGHDFSQVRIHADAPAHQAARALQAQAYTLGTDIVFAAGRYEPDTHEGRRLLAHELVHVVQQQGSAQHVQRQPEDGTDVPAPEVPGAPDPALELGEQNKNTEVACKAFASMIRATEGICRVAGEDSPECEKATTRVRGHAGTLGPLCNSTMPQIVFKEQRTSGAACGSNATLGVGGFSLTNPEEMVYHVPPYARCFLDQFEIRRTVQDETYEKVGGTWRQVASTPAGTDDTPGPNPYADCMKPPYLRSYDSPGWVYNTRQLSVGAGGLKTSPNATEVQLSLNFFEWVRATGPGRMVTSDKAEWSTVLRLVWSGTAWKFAPGSSISLGHVKLGPPA